MNSLKEWLKKLTFGQWLAIIMAVIAIATYIGTQEAKFSEAQKKAQEDHDETVRIRLSNRIWRDSIMNVLKIHDYRMSELERKQQEKKDRDNQQEDVEENRMDQIEKELIKTSTELKDFKEYHHK